MVRFRGDECHETECRKELLPALGNTAGSERTPTLRSLFEQRAAARLVGELDMARQLQVDERRHRARLAELRRHGRVVEKAIGIMSGTSGLATSARISSSRVS